MQALPVYGSGKQGLETCTTRASPWSSMLRATCPAGSENDIHMTRATTYSATKTICVTGWLCEAGARRQRASGSRESASLGRGISFNAIVLGQTLVVFALVEGSGKEVPPGVSASQGRG
jgi:hypothetical protein